MRLSSALLLLTVGSTPSFGKAFATSNTSFVGKSNAETALTFPPSFVTVRGGSKPPLSTLSATKECVELDEVVAKYISQDNWDLLSKRGQISLANLIKGDEGVEAQTHVYGNWPEKGSDDEGKIQLSEQVSFDVTLIF